MMETKAIPRHSMSVIYAYIGVVLGVNVGIYGSPISRVWDMYTLPEIMELDELGWPGRACPPKVLGGG